MWRERGFPFQDTATPYEKSPERNLLALCMPHKATLAPSEKNICYMFGGKGGGRGKRAK